MQRLSKLRFDALAGYIRSPYSILFAEELDWYQAGDERVLGVVSVDVHDTDFAATVLGRDARGRFRAVDLSHSLPFREEAIGRLATLLSKWAEAPDDDFHQGDESGQRVDFFTPTVDEEKLARAFRAVLKRRGYTPARGILDAMTYYFEDPDGNFVSQFQTSGFDARLWELYLYAAFTEMGYAMDRSHAAPDFHCVGPLGDFFVEATTVNPSSQPPEITDENRQQYLTDYVAMKFGSALWSKLTKRPPYWELSHVRGKPFVLAIQDFHADGSMTWSNSALREYLYGIRQGAVLGTAGSTQSLEIESYTWQGKTIPAGFFKQRDAEHVSAVVANAGGTLTKFNRMGLISGFGDQAIRMVRQGLAYQGEVTPRPFQVTVDPNSRETWCEGLEVFHNPNAEMPLPEMAMPDAAHTILESGRILTVAPAFFPIGSTTLILSARGLDANTGSEQEQSGNEMAD